MKYLRTADLAKAVGVHPNTVRRYVDRGYCLLNPLNLLRYLFFVPAAGSWMKENMEILENNLVATNSFNKRKSKIVISRVYNEVRRAGILYPSFLWSLKVITEP